jgi:hypothetical protein
VASRSRSSYHHQQQPQQQLKTVTWPA